MVEIADISDLSIKGEVDNKPEREKDRPKARVKPWARRGAMVGAAAFMGAAGLGIGATHAEATQLEPSVTQMEQEQKEEDINDVIEKSQQEVAKEISDLYVNRSSLEDSASLEGNKFNFSLNFDSDMQPNGRYTHYELSTSMRTVWDGETEGYDPRSVEMSGITVTDMGSNPDDARTMYSLAAIKDTNSKKWNTNASYGEKNFGLSTVPGAQPPGKTEYLKHFEKMKEMLQHAEKADYMKPIAPPQNVPERPALH